jgi:hypothetical protein
LPEHSAQRHAWVRQSFARGIEKEHKIEVLVASLAAGNKGFGADDVRKLRSQAANRRQANFFTLAADVIAESPPEEQIAVGVLTPCAMRTPKN